MQREHASAADPLAKESRFRQKFPLRSVAGIAVCIIYVVSPVDLIPEVFLGPLGLADDSLALLIASRLYVTGRRLQRSGV